MVIQLEAWHITLLIAVMTLFGSLIKYSLSQLESRFNERLIAQGSQSANAEQKCQLLERELLTLKSNLPLDYIRREDYIRNQTELAAKLDALASKLEQIYQRGITHA